MTKNPQDAAEASSAQMIAAEAPQPPAEEKGFDELFAAWLQEGERLDHEQQQFTNARFTIRYRKLALAEKTLMKIGNYPWQNLLKKATAQRLEKFFAAWKQQAEEKAGCMESSEKATAQISPAGRDPGPSVKQCPCICERCTLRQCHSTWPHGIPPNYRHPGDHLCIDCYNNMIAYDSDYDLCLPSADEASFSTCLPCGKVKKNERP